jgi:hypothetical protein
MWAITPARTFAAQRDLIVWNNLSPRAGFAWQIPHSHGLVLRGTYFRLYEPLAGRYLDFGNPNSLGGSAYQWIAANSTGSFQPGEQGSLLLRFGGPYSSISPTLRRPYSEFADAPMRTLLLDGAEPDINRQKALNTFAKRDHVRVWKRPDPWQGRTVWASAATRDVAISFSLRYGFTHQVQTEVGLERDRVVSDLLFTGCATSVSYVSRPEAGPSIDDEGRKGFSTDGRVAVLALNCRGRDDHH